MIYYFRRRKLGKGSTHGMMRHHASVGVQSSTILAGFRYPREYTVGDNDQVSFRRYHQPIEVDGRGLLIRWGCTARISDYINNPGLVVFNQAEAISLVNNKRDFRHAVRNEYSECIPTTWFNENSYQEDGEPKAILRATRHAQGRNLFVVNNSSELSSLLERPIFQDGWYLSRYIPKVKEFRVYIVKGKVATVAEKVPNDPSAIAWNVAQGASEFRVVSWGDWHMPSISAAMKAFIVSGLDFGGVDVMVDDLDNPYVLEINSAPSLPPLSNGSVSYRQSCMAKCFAYHHEELTQQGFLSNWNHVEFDFNGWREVVHPAITGEEYA